MTTDKQTEALKLALEANTALREWVNAVPIGTPLPAMPGIDGDWLDEVDATIRKALAEQPAQPQTAFALAMGPDEREAGFYQRGYDKGYANGVNAAKKPMIPGAKPPQPAQPQQEPVAVARVDDLERGGRVRALAMGLSLDAPLYTSPPAPRKPLTLREIAEATNEYADVWSDKTIGIARAIEAAHGIKE